MKLLALALLTFGELIHAACSSPTGVTGQFLYYAPNSTYQVCDGTVWNSMASGAPTATSCSVAGQITFGSAPRFCNGSFLVPMSGTETGAACSSTSGTFQYNPTLGFMQHCNGSNLIAMRSASASVSYIQQSILIGNDGSTHPSYTSATFSGSKNLSAGNTLICSAWYSGGTSNTISSVTISGGQTLTKIVGPTNLAGGTAGFRTDIWYRPGLTAVTNATVTFNVSIATDQFYALCNEYSGVQTVNAVDQSTAKTAGTATITTSSLTSTSAKSLLFSSATFDSTDPTPGSGYTTRGTVMSNCMTMDKIVSTIGSYTASVGGGSGSTSGTVSFVILRSQ